MRVSLNNQGYNIGIHQTAILMKQANVVAIRPRKRHYYPDAGTRYKKAENLLNREFEQQTLNTHWVGDTLASCVCHRRVQLQWQFV
jgi:transposase InsO family protein